MTRPLPRLRRLLRPVLLPRSVLRGSCESPAWRAPTSSSPRPSSARSRVALFPREQAIGVR